VCENLYLRTQQIYNKLIYKIDRAILNKLTGRINKFSNNVHRTYIVKTGNDYCTSSR